MLYVTWISCTKWKEIFVLSRAGWFKCVLVNTSWEQQGRANDIIHRKRERERVGASERRQSKEAVQHRHRAAQYDSETVRVCAYDMEGQHRLLLIRI